MEKILAGIPKAPSGTSTGRIGLLRFLLIRSGELMGFIQKAICSFIMIVTHAKLKQLYNLILDIYILEIKYVTH